MIKGIIEKGIAGFYYVYVDDVGVYECKAKGAFRNQHLKPLVGDWVEISVIDEEKKLGNIENILPRKNDLIRPNVANIDGALVIFAAKNPDPNLNLLDRFLVMMEYQNVPSVICFNKSDLCSEDELKELAEIYSAYPVICITAKNMTDDMSANLREHLDGNIFTVAGPSGAGKSTLVNSLQNHTVMETGEISKKLNRGKHTTRHAQIIPIGKSSYIMDTPGFSSMDIPGFTKEDLAECYPEFRELSPLCRFAGCAHINEPNCGVKDALEAGEISRVRYDNYLKLYEELANRKPVY